MKGRVQIVPRPVPLDYEIWEETHRPTITRLQQTIDRRALEARLQGYHHSGFLVGAAGIGFGAGGYKMPYGSNYKSKPGTAGPRVCVEDAMMQHAFLNGCTDIVSFSFAAFYQADNHSGGDWDGCLIPCIHCQRKFEESFHTGDLISPQTNFTSLRLGSVDGEIVVLRKATGTIGELIERFPSEVF